MELKEFVKNVLIEVNTAVDEASSETSREIRFSTGKAESRTVEFDIAVSAENSTDTSGKAGVKVLSFMEAGADVKSKDLNSTVSRVTFGLNIAYRTKQEDEENERRYRESRNNRSGNNFLY